MLAERKEDYEYYDYEEPSYEEVKAAPKPRLRTVTARKTRTRLDTKLRTRCQILFVVVAVLAMVVTIRSGISASRGYALVATQQEAQLLEQENERLKIEIAKLKSPARIRAIAAESLGMEVPDKMYFSHE